VRKYDPGCAPVKNPQVETIKFVNEQIFIHIFQALKHLSIYNSLCYPLSFSVPSQSPSIITKETLPKEELAMGEKQAMVDILQHV
jgi:hypothetical protein